MPDTVRLIHVSDVHLTRRLDPRRVADLARKRLTGFAAGVVTGRRRHFRHAMPMMAAFEEFLAAASPDFIVFSGDATTLALPEEFTAASTALRVHDRPGIAVPGNHDKYVASAALAFERHFAPWQLGERLPGHAYPFAVRVGPVWLIALDSAKPNWRITDSTGALGMDQLKRMRDLCERLSPGPRIVVTHYPLARPDGKPEGIRRRLLDWANAVRAARDCDIKAWLHGHIHTGFIAFPTAAIPLTRLCAGSVTQHGRRTFGDYSVSGDGIVGLRRQYCDHSQRFRPAETFEFRW